MNLEKKEKLLIDISLRLKLIILFADYIIIIGIISIFDSLSMTSIEEEYPWLFRLSIYLFYYVLPEYIFKSTLAMRLFNVSLKAKNTMDFKREFLIYSVLVFFDRFLLLVVYIFRVLFFTNRNLLLSEKYSGLSWSNLNLSR